MIKSTSLALAMALVTAGCSTQQQGKMVVYGDPGGSITKRMVEIAKLNNNNTYVEIKGHCISACTMYLGVDNVCVHHDALLEFHSPYWLRGIPGVLYYPVEMSEKDHRIYTAQVAQYYPPNLKSNYLKDWSTKIHQHHKMTGQEVHDMDPEHVDLC